MNEDSITGIYCDVDDFCKALEGYCKSRLLPHGKAPKWFPASALSLSEVMTVIVLFHLSGYRCFKRYYQRHVRVHMRDVFPQSGQLQPVCGTDARRITPSASLHAGIQAGKVNGHQLCRFHALEGMP